MEPIKPGRERAKTNRKSTAKASSTKGPLRRQSEAEKSACQHGSSVGLDCNLLLTEETPRKASGAEARRYESEEEDFLERMTPEEDGLDFQLTFNE